MNLREFLSTMKLFTPVAVRRPAYLIFFVTSACIGRCRHCFFWRQINRPEDPLSPEEAGVIGRSLPGLLQATFTGGEPFLRKDFVELVLRFVESSRPYHCAIATSGYLTDETIDGVRRILESCGGTHLTVGLPIEGPLDLNDDIRGMDGFYERTTRTLAGLKKLQQRWPGLSILVDITASGFNRGRLSETYRMVRDRLRPDNINLILTRGRPRENEALDLDPREIRQVLGEMKEDVRRGRLKGYRFWGRLLQAKDIVLRETALDIFQGERPSLPCGAGRIAGVLMPGGEVFGCELRPQPLGNIRNHDYNFEPLWTSDSATDFRRKILSDRCLCYHQCFLSNSIFFNYRMWPKILATLAGLM